MQQSERERVLLLLWWYAVNEWLTEWLSRLDESVNEWLAHGSRRCLWPDGCEFDPSERTLLNNCSSYMCTSVCLSVSLVCLSVSLWAVLSSESWSDHILLLVCHRLVLVGTRYQYKEVTNYLKIILASGTLIKHITSYDIWHRQCRRLVSSETAPYKI